MSSRHLGHVNTNLPYNYNIKTLIITELTIMILKFLELDNLSVISNSRLFLVVVVVVVVVS